MTPSEQPVEINLPQLGGKSEGKIAPSRNSKLRFTVLIIIQVLIIAHIVQWLITGTTITPIEPSESMETVKYGVITVGFIFFVVTLASTAVLGRWFCGWGCHVVLLQDASAKFLQRIGIRPRPFRSRVLMFMPLALAMYMFLWPLFDRFVVAPMLGRGGNWPGFSTHLTTSDFWGTFPGWIVGIPFLLICGFFTVYFLGMKGYCTYGCPYGGFFAPLDQLAIGRIKVNDNCEQCGHCTAVCTSNVRVHEEVRDFGMVIDQGCMKCMDCVSVCPMDALSFGIAKPAIKKVVPEGRKERSWDLTRNEDIVFGVITVITFLSVYQLYGLVPLLFASGLTALMMFFLFKAWSCFKRTDVKIHNWQLKRAGRVTGKGKVYLLGSIILCAFIVHSASVRSLMAYADYHDMKITSTASMVFSTDPVIPDTPILEHARKARAAYQAASWIGDGGIALLPMLQPEIDNRIAWLYSVENRRDEAADFLRESMRKYGMSPEKIAGLARILRSQSKSLEASETYLRGINEYPANFQIMDEYVIWLEGEGRPWEAITLLREGIANSEESVPAWLALEGFEPEKVDEISVLLTERPEILAMIRRLSVLLMNNAETPFDLAEGVRLTERTLDVAPENPFAYRALALGYVLQDRNDKGIEALYRSFELEPNEPTIRQQLVEILNAEGRVREAEAVSRGEMPESRSQ